MVVHQSGALSQHKMMLAQLTEQYNTINSAASLRSVKKVSSTLIETTTRSAPTLPSAVLLQENSYTNQIEQLVEQALRDATEESSDTLWEDVLLMTDKKVYINKSNDNCVKLVGTLNGTAAAAFDLFYDICEQPLWATISDETNIVQVLDPYTRIIYCKLKALWPTTSRDIVFISHIRKVRSGTFLQVSQSIEYPPIPVRDGIIRMKLNRVVQQFTVTLPSDKCSFIQIIDVDPGGWIPKSLIRFCKKIYIHDEHN